MIEKGQRLHPGDILRNDWASETNPNLYIMYVKRGKVGQHPTFDCLAYDGRMRHYGVDDNRLVVVGHLNKYDEFIKALSKLRLMKQDRRCKEYLDEEVETDG